MQDRADKLHTDETEIASRKANMPEEARKLAEERTETLRTKLEERATRIAQKEGERPSSYSSLNTLIHKAFRAS